MLVNNINKVICLAMLVFGASASYANNNFTCPSPEEIQSTNFTVPSIWVAPPVAHSEPGQVGVGLGGTEVKKLLGVEKAKVNGKDGWVCVYKSKGGTAIADYQTKIRGIVAGNKFLIKYLEKLNKAFDDAEPYLKHYPKDEPIGFIGYELEGQDQQQQQQQQRQMKK